MTHRIEYKRKEQNRNNYAISAVNIMLDGNVNTETKSVIYKNPNSESK